MTDTALFYRDILLVAMDDEHGSEPFRTDVLIEGERIAAVGPGLVVPEGAVITQGTDLLMMPGLVNAHLHSWEAFFRGRYDNLPLELWMLFSYPMLGLTPMSKRAIELRTMMVAIESLKGGVTCVLDDVIESPGQSLEQLAAVFRGYRALGIRAGISGNIVDRTFTDTIPFANEMVPTDLLDKVRATPPRSAEAYLEFSREALRTLHDKDGLLHYVVAPSGPQRCTDALLQAADQLSREFDTTLHIHVLETKTQAVTGRQFYGGTLVEHLDRLGVLSDRTTLAHGIWLTPSDIAVLARAGSSVAHNPISNQKLGAGIAPFRALLDAGVNVALGSDGLCSNDSARMFDVMKSAALLHKITTPDHFSWPTAHQILWAATRGGAQSVRLRNDIGAVEPGRFADVVVLDTRTVNFTPLNVVPNHLVYCENGASIKQVVVNGVVVVEDDQCTLVDENAVLDEIREMAPELLAAHGEIERINEAFLPYFEQIHARCNSTQLTINRYGAAEDGWVSHKA
jgi:5-methylthioadenosine/S-adenosylhomocysteine deaminase